MRAAFRRDASSRAADRDNGRTSRAWTSTEAIVREARVE